MSCNNVNFEMERSPVGMGIRKVSKTLKASDFTDNANTTGDYTWTSALPAGSFYIGCRAVVKIALDEDTSATMTVGKTAGEDEFSDGTSISLLAVATVGQEGEAPLEFATSATSVYLRITSTSDFTLLYASDGEFTLDLYYLSTVPEMN